MCVGRMVEPRWGHKEKWDRKCALSLERGNTMKEPLKPRPKIYLFPLVLVPWVHNLVKRNEIHAHDVCQGCIAVHRCVPTYAPCLHLTLLPQKGNPMDVPVALLPKKEISYVMQDPLLPLMDPGED